MELFTAHAIQQTLREHWLVSVNCNHDEKTDKAQCSCSLVTFPERLSVGAAVDDWIFHVLEILSEGPNK